MKEKLLNIFTEAKDEYVSGEYLSRLLGISRTAIWKRIRKLEEDGYVFESVPRLGYRLLERPERIQLPLIEQQLQTKTFGKPIQYFPVLESTQTAAHEAQLSGAPEGLALIAEEQLSGRGRRGRSFFSPPGKGIYMSFLLRPDLPLRDAAQMTLLVSVALCRAVRRVSGADATIKWPNDVLINGKKMSGILVDTVAEAANVKAMIVGIGVSVNMDGGDFPEELRGKATSIKCEIGESVSRETLIAAFFNQFEALYEMYFRDGFAPIRFLWEALSSTLQQEAVVTTAKGELRGIAVGITGEGALLLRDASGTVHSIYSGDLAVPF